MVTVDKAVIARIEKQGQHFEVLVDPEVAFELKSGKTVSVSKMLAVNAVFKDSKKGEKASPELLEKAFASMDVNKIAEMIVKQGDIQLTTELLRKHREEKRRQIAAYIHTNALDPRTKVPHPIERVLTAMDQAGFNVDANKSIAEQIDKVIDAIKGIIPLSFEKIRIQILVGPQYAGQAYGALKRFGVEQSKWLNNGGLQATVAITAGLKDDLYSEINAVTNGTVQIKEE
ncbi:MAG: ribosome assembly factor SBDS [Candidatus Aenigmatarchaeota archaeon]